MLVFVLGDWRSLALRGAAAVVFGVLSLVWPRISLTALVLLFGAYALIDGVVILVDALRARDAQQRRWGPLLEGAVSIAAGLVTLVWPGITALVLLYVIAAWALITGALEIAAAVRLRRELTNEWLLGIAGVLSIAFAILLVVTPGSGALVITWAIAWYAILFGALLIALALRLRRLEAQLAVPRPKPQRAG